MNSDKFERPVATMCRRQASTHAVGCVKVITLPIIFGVDLFFFTRVFVFPSIIAPQFLADYVGTFGHTFQPYPESETTRVFLETPRTLR